MDNFFLKNIVNPMISTFLDQGWISLEYVGIVNVHDGMILKDYIAILKANNIRLYENEDELIWIYSKIGKHTPKEVGIILRTPTKFIFIINGRISLIYRKNSMIFYP